MNEESIHEEEMSSGEDNTPNAEAPKSNFFSDLLEKYPLLPQIVLGSVGVLILIITIIYFAFSYKPPLERYADQFCDCAAPVESPVYERSMDGFGYISVMESCFADDFSKYSDGMTKADKKAYLLSFQEKVLQKCPEKLDNVFEYK